MELDTVKEEFVQANESEARNIFNELMRKSVRLGLLKALEEEVNSLCGKKHYPDAESPYYRAGSEKGSFYANGKKEEVIRPRVRHKEGGEVSLAVYEEASQQRNLFDEVVSSLGEGVSSRGVSRTTKNAVSKSAASRMWIEQSREQLEFFRRRDIGALDLVGLQIDGVFVGKEVCVVIALGIDLEGNKHILDFEQGTAESATCVGSLIKRLHQRGVTEPEGRRLLVQRDGSAAIAKAVRQYYPNAVQQECVVHLHRQLKDKLRRKDGSDLDAYFKRFREAQGVEAGEEAWDELFSYVNDRNSVAAKAMNERKDALLAFHRLDVPATLNTTFLSTNIIENAIRNWRSHTGNVKLWKDKQDMVSRWAASGLLWVENTFKKVRGAEDLNALEAALSFSDTATVANAPSASSPKDKEVLKLATSHD